MEERTNPMRLTKEKAEAILTAIDWNKIKAKAEKTKEE